ncbi:MULTISPECIES: MMPL family transporter [Streptomyces]|uniref:MMPL family transporter n=1 Tax=Streptomyces TaxID=1883 RepID=UPI001FE4C807|nr:MMPL family transporter [Streptomyces harbinensis]
MSVFDRIAELAIRRPRLILIVAFVAVLVMGAVGGGAFDRLRDGGFDDPASSSSRAGEIIEEKFGGETNLILLVEAPDGVDDPAARESGAALVAELRAEDGLANIVSYWETGSPDLRSQDGTEALVLAHVRGEETELAEHTDAVVDGYTGTYDGTLTVRAGGGAAIGSDMSTQVVDDLILAEVIAVPLVLLLLLVVFGSVVAALLPLVIVVIAIAGTFAQLAILGGITEVSINATNLTTALGLGLGVDYALLMTSRFRDRLAAGVRVEDAVRQTVVTAGRTVAFSAATVAAALGTLLVFPQYFLRSIGYAGVGVVAIAAVSTLFVMPALFMLLGHRVNKGRMPWVKPGAPVVQGSLWGRLARAVMRRPVLTALPVLAVLLASTAPLLGITFGVPDERVLPTGAESRQVSEALRDNFEGNDDAALHIVIDEPVAGPELAGYAVGLSALTGVVRVESSAGTFADGSATAVAAGNPGLGRDDAERITVVSGLTPASDAAQDLVREVRAIAGPGGSQPLVGGSDAALIDSKDSIGDRIPLALGLIAGTTFVLLFLFTGSIVQPLRALVLNMLTLGATLGVMTWIFQEGNLSGPLGFTPQPMELAMTVLMFCIAFGLSMDYEVFITSRIKELHDEGADNETAVAEGLGHTGRIVTAAAVLLAVSFFAFGTAQISFMQMFGLGSGLAILLDAVVVRGVLVPASMRLLGRWNWYAPAVLRKVHARIGLREGGTAPQPGTVQPPSPALPPLPRREDTTRV